MNRLASDWCCILLVALTCISNSPPAYSQGIQLPDLGSDKVSYKKLNEFKDEYYKFDENGKLVDGFRNARNEPIDFSPLVTDHILAEDYLKASLGCTDCAPRPFSWEGKRLSYGVLTENNQHLLRFAFPAGSALYDVFNKANISSRSTRDLSEADLVIIFGSIDFLLSKARRLGDHTTAEYYASVNQGLDSEQATDDKIARLFKGTHCRILAPSRSGRHKAYAYLTPEHIDECFAKQLLVAAGLLPFEGYTPSALNLAYSYKYATVADTLFLRLLYFMGNNEVDTFGAYEAEVTDLIGLYDYEQRLR
ncbi:hypothetical protein [Ruegeria jejuensis]|uniref:hypothetical protein n=1 Tax=Ruegeria jejuensis TaxID=3233338 RepID=UPI00355B2CA6